MPIDYVDDAENRLRQAGVAAPRNEAECLAAHTLGQAAYRPVPAPTESQLQAFKAMVERRCAGAPLEHVTGIARFRKLDLLVGPGVFVPQPETSCVVQWAVDALRALIAAGQSSPLCLDLCTGTGTIALSVASEVPPAQVHAVELDPGALAWASKNAAHHGLDITLHQADAGDALPDFDGRFDLVTSNPPYVATSEMSQVRREVRDHDPAIALSAGTDGLDLIRRIERTGRRLLKPGGQIVVEHSDRQGVTAPAAFRAGGGWTQIEDHVDHDQLDRFLTARRT